MGTIFGVLVFATVFTVISAAFYFGSGIVEKEVRKTVEIIKNRKKNV